MSRPRGGGRWLPVIGLLSAWGLSGACDNPGSPRPNPGRTQDAGISARDAGPTDAGPFSDAGTSDAMEAATMDATTTDAGRADAAEPLVVVTLNTHSFQEGPDSLAKLEAIGEGLASLGADLVGLNEVMSGTSWAFDFQGEYYDGTERIKTALQNASGGTWHDRRHGFAHWDDGEEMSNVILSRFPILQTDHRFVTTTDFWPAPRERRSVVYAKVDTDEVGPVDFFVTHTYGWDSADTEPQIAEVKAYLESKYDGTTPQILVGDLNVPSTAPAYGLWVNAPPFAMVDTFGAANPDEPARSTIVGEAHRIDYVLARDAPEPSRSWIVFDGGALPIVSDHMGVATAFVSGRGNR